MQRVPAAQFEPVLQRRLEELWGKPVNLYRALGNHPALTEAVMACNVTHAVHAEVKQHFSDAEFVELSLTAGFYAMVSRMLDAMRVELDEDVREHQPRLG